MNVKELLEGYYNATLTDAQENELELRMRAGDPEIPEQERRMYLGIARLPEPRKAVRSHKSLFLSISSVAAAVLLVLGMGIYAYSARQQQRATEQEILEMAMGNVSLALQQSDSSRARVAAIFDVLNSDSTKTENTDNEINL